jgi:hypothetical protein
MAKTLFEVERDGAEAFRRSKESNRLIEPLPRRLDLADPWVVNLNTGAIEANGPIMVELGDTIYTEYDPTDEELEALRAGRRVRVSPAMLARLKSGEYAEAPKIIVPVSVKAEQRAARAEAGHAGMGSEASVAKKKPKPAAAAAFALPAEATPSPLASAFQLADAPDLK